MGNLCISLGVLYQFPGSGTRWYQFRDALVRLRIRGSKAVNLLFSSVPVSLKIPKNLVFKILLLTGTTVLISLKLEKVIVGRYYRTEKVIVGKYYRTEKVIVGRYYRTDQQ